MKFLFKKISTILVLLLIYFIYNLFKGLEEQNTNIFIEISKQYNLYISLFEKNSIVRFFTYLSTYVIFSFPFYKYFKNKIF